MRELDLDLDLDHMEQRLLDERDRARAAIRQIQSELEVAAGAADGDLSRLPTHPADAASDTQEAEKDLLNVDRESEKLARIDEALRVLRDHPDSYGVCDRCGRPIDPERLDLLPWTRLCSSCATQGRG